MSWLQSPLLRALRDPAVMAGFGAPQWDLALRQARSADLLGRLAALARQHDGLLSCLPAPVLRHFSAAQSVVTRQHKAVHWETQQIAQTLLPTGAPMLLLKGAAYAMADAPAALGRTFSDIDILVPKAQLDEVESALILDGWLTATSDAYDQRYYRRWMHELPPMTHLERQTTLDVHHAILPETARIRSRPELLLAAMQPVPGFANVHVPAPTDQILHSACHLFHEGEWGHGLRDLSDLDLLLRANGTSEKAGHALLARAQALNLTIPLAYAVRCAHRVFQTPLPQELLARLRDRSWMDALFLQAVSTAHASMASPASPWARRILYIRSHWLRMPLHLLLPHLAHQAFKREKDT
ncbi:nucleotidyltransferase family protein [Pseudorhodoferax sp. Leaf267]|uniref:nucleotidyltransferase family protein n=1 Tax=Pseudorhodoferax sp. Leaf267 TaxID=1736316 RepID=UPI000700E75F|nr:nucleotidyltransferase family protein [Pseudorhodoferax sp. Leaf267]KQP22027.1 hypothetical protein ASF43_24610 [Pseudorhodoferax sp. Leaf267]